MIDPRIVLAAFVLVFFSIGDMFAKKVLAKFNYATAAAAVSIVSAIPAIVAFAISPSFNTTAYSLELSILAGVFYGLGFMLLYKALTTEQTTNTMALSEFFKAILVLFAVFVVGETLANIQSIGIVGIFAGSLLIITTKTVGINKKMGYALAGFISWAVFWIMLEYAIFNSQGYIVEEGVASLASFAIAVVYILSRKDLNQFGQIKKLLTIKDGNSKFHIGHYTVIVGLGVGLASFIFAYLILAHSLALGSAIIAMTPVVVAVASRRLYLDKLTVYQMAGLLIMVVGALALALG